ncbi:MAG: hypothetical protein K0Q62_1148 [Phenylobacterium sp.]|jgi:general stress protein YciG|nr:hypothetical protein [Phenylobacterium sp.]
MADEPKDPKLRGFAKMSPERRREVASKGGSSVEPQERAFARDPDLASRAGRIGGEARPKADKGAGKPGR